MGLLGLEEDQEVVLCALGRVSEIEPVKLSGCYSKFIQIHSILSKIPSNSFNSTENALNFTQLHSKFTQTHSNFVPKFPLRVNSMKNHLAEATLSHLYEYYTLHSIRYTLYSVLYTLYSILYDVYSILHALCSMSY